MEKFDADIARKLSKDANFIKLHKILKDIRLECNKGERVLFVNEKLDTNIINNLKERGFEVIEKCNPFYTEMVMGYDIKW